MTEVLTQNGYLLSRKFTEIFDEVVPSLPAPEVQGFDFVEGTKDIELFETLGESTKEELLGILIDLTQKQKTGTEEGELSTFTHNILGYVTFEGETYCITVDWGSLNEEWRCNVRGMNEWTSSHRFMQKV